MNEAQLRTVWQQRQRPDRVAHLSDPLGRFMKYTLSRRVRQFGDLVKLWEDIIPTAIRDHTALESFNQGVLKVAVDSAAHRFQLQTLLAGGLLKRFQERFAGALKKIALEPGQFYILDETGAERYEF